MKSLLIRLYLILSERLAYRAAEMQAAQDADKAFCFVDEGDMQFITCERFAKNLAAMCKGDWLTSTELNKALHDAGDIDTEEELVQARFDYAQQAARMNAERNQATIPEFAVY